MLSHVQLFEIPWTVSHQLPPSMGFSRQEYWIGLTFSPPGYLHDPGIKTQVFCVSCIAGAFFTIEPLGKPQGRTKCNSKNKNNLWK